MGSVIELVEMADTYRRLYFPPFMARVCLLSSELAHKAIVKSVADTTPECGTVCFLG